MVAFSLVQSASSWVKNCGFEFPFIVDTSRSLFVSLGLRRSVLAVWNMPALIGYAEQLRAGRQLLRSLEGDDVHQLGGDFIVDSTGRLVYAYCGKTSYDRPSVSDLLAKLKEVSTGNESERNPRIC